MKNLYLLVLMILLPLTTVAQEKYVRSFNNLISLLYSNPNEVGTAVLVEGYQESGDWPTKIMRYYSDNTSATNTYGVFKPFNYNGRWIVIGDSVSNGSASVANMANSAIFTGDSVVQGSSASSTANTWWYIVSTNYNFAYTNLAFGGAVVTDLIYQSYPGYNHTNEYNLVNYYSPSGTSTNFNIFSKVGINDGADFPITSSSFWQYQTNYYKCLMAFASYWLTPNKVTASNMTAVGSWARWTNGPTAGFGGIGKYSTTSSETLTFTTMGDAIYLAYLVGLTNSTTLGQFIVSIDGVAVETVNPNGVGFGNRNQWTTPVSYIPYTATNTVWVNRYSGYGERIHTVTITSTNNSASLPTVILWGAGSQQTTGNTYGPNVWILENLNRLTDATRDSTYAYLRSADNRVVYELASDGLQIGIITPNNYYNTNGLSGDNIHPNDTGMIQIADSVKQKLDSVFRYGSVKNPPKAYNGVKYYDSSIGFGGSIRTNTSITTSPYTLTYDGTVNVYVDNSEYGGHIQADNSFPLVVDSSATPNIYIRKVRGTIANPTAVQNGDVLARFNVSPYAGSSTYQTSSYIQAVATENHSVGAAGSAIDVYAVPNLSTTPNQVARFASGAITLYGTISANDSVTINTANTQLNLQGDSQFGALMSRVNSSSSKEIGIQRARAGTTALQSGDTVGQIGWYPYNGSSYPGRRAVVRADVTENQTVGANGTQVVIGGTANGSTTVTDMFFVSGSGSKMGANGSVISRLRHGTAVLVAGTVTVSDSNVTASTIIMLTCQTPGGTPGFLRISARVAATSFTILSSSGTDTSTVGYVMFEP